MAPGKAVMHFSNPVGTSVYRFLLFSFIFFNTDIKSIKIITADHQLRRYTIGSQGILAR